LAWLRSSVLAASVAAAGAAGPPGKAPVTLDQFEGWQSWPLVGPGELGLDRGDLLPLRIELDGRFPGPQGFGKGPLDPVTMYMDVLNASFHGRPAVWVQWTADPRVEHAAPALDLLVVDRATFRLLYRIAASARGEWAGRYEVLQARPGRLVQASVGEDGATETRVLEPSAEYFDFASYPFLLPLLDLREGLALRLSGYDYLAKEPEVLALRVAGRTTISDARGAEHEVWQVDVMPPHRATLITFYVTKAPPYFYGWSYRVTRDGRTAVELTYRSWVPTSTK
jgi:hypothetical protein